MVASLLCCARLYSTPLLFLVVLLLLPLLPAAADPCPCWRECKVTSHTHFHLRPFLSGRASFPCNYRCAPLRLYPASPRSALVRLPGFPFLFYA
ncbi:hypothetical protein B0T26DRAFT_221616 [Lasiosphaeria miniovina]|uniref:Secreted protein n=1 Tax=Lasiosphaeria miniovina TaxID=1954250 RepID=A0AA40AUZ0_9PEZI|nr:uncharacterized protein B0T26DRAFT_221616 [Lasiosphaeria miniovina]KAK0722488.1 hypothetical protein B0T26DRAFT_221616 [Lasiosphaeria miniovina]